MIDAALAVNAASWPVAEFLRLFHSQDNQRVIEIMADLTKRPVPYIERFGDELTVSRKLGCDIEILLLLAHTEPKGRSRRDLGTTLKYAPPRVSEALKRLQEERRIHLTRDGLFRITGPGSQRLEELLAANGAVWTG